MSLFNIFVDLCTWRRVMLLSKPDPDIYPQVREALLHLLGLDLEVFVEPSMLSYLEVNDLVHNLPSVATEACQQQNRQYQQQDCHYPVDDIVDSLGDRSMAVNNHSSMGNKYISRNSDKSQDTVDRVCKMQGGASELVRRPILHTYTTGCKVDLVITFGGDGLLLHCNTLFGSSPVPPVMGFDFGSLGFLSPFQFDEFQPEVNKNDLGHLQPVLSIETSSHNIYMNRGLYTNMPSRIYSDSPL